jgi:predicted aldo/keto reductase-like oxidoreductase
MQYRHFGKLDWEASALGFGCMRLPIIDGDSSKINEEEATRMLHSAIEQGVNYIDTAYGYHGGNSERVVGRALLGGYRERVHLATKLPCWLVKTSADFDRLLNEQLQKLQTDHIDFYLLHALDAERWHTMRDLGIIPWLESAIASGRIRQAGFSFHDGIDAFKEIIDAWDGWTLCQIQYNDMDIHEQAGTSGLKYAAARGLAVVVMEPLRGGKLADPPDKVRRVWDDATQKRTPVDWALQWLWNQPEVSVVLSGMSTMQQVQENISSAAASAVNQISDQDLVLIDRAREAYEGLSPIPCTKCAYCMPCPNGLNIPGLFDIFNRAVMYSAFDEARGRYEHLRPEERANNCGKCLNCEGLCPQHIEVSSWMERIHPILGEKQPYVA